VLKVLKRAHELMRGKGGEGQLMSAIRALALMNVMLKANLPYHEALASSREIAKGPHRRLIDRIFRGTLLGNYPSLERALETETEGLPREVVWIGRTLREYLICGSEPSQARREEMLDRAFSSALDSCRHSMKEATSGLRVPVSTIFALGIVLPIVLATMLPLWGAAYSDGLAQEFRVGADPDAGIGFPSLALATPILVFPGLCLIASARVLSKGEFAPCRGDNREIALILAFFGVAGAATFVILFVLGLDVDILFFIAAAIPAAMLAGRLLAPEDAGGGEDSMYDHPSELNSISARLMSGEHFVRAVAMAAEDRSEKRRIFWQAMSAPEAEPADPGFDGEMAWLLSETAKSDSSLAAHMLRQMARHLNDLGLVRAEMSFDLRPIAQSVLVATVFLSPFVLGIAAGFGYISQDAASPVGNLFVVFIAEMVISGIWLIKGMGVGEGFLGKIAGRPSLALGIAGLAFLLSLSFSRAMSS